jgi:hypothetical protein
MGFRVLRQCRRAGTCQAFRSCRSWRSLCSRGQGCSPGCPVTAKSTQASSMLPAALVRWCLSASAASCCTSRLSPSLSAPQTSKHTSHILLEAGFQYKCRPLQQPCMCPAWLCNTSVHILLLLLQTLHASCNSCPVMRIGVEDCLCLTCALADLVGTVSAAAPSPPTCCQQEASVLRHAV